MKLTMNPAADRRVGGHGKAFQDKSKPKDIRSSNIQAAKCMHES